MHIILIIATLLDTSHIPWVLAAESNCKIFVATTYLLVPFCYFLRCKACIFYQKFSVLMTKFVFSPAVLPKFSVFLCLFVVPTEARLRHGRVESDYPSSLTSNCNENSFQNIKSKIVEITGKLCSNSFLWDFSKLKLI